MSESRKHSLHILLINLSGELSLQLEILLTSDPSFKFQLVQETTVHASPSLKDPPCDLYLIHHNPPDFDGLAFLQNMASRNEFLPPILFLSLDEDPLLDLAAMEAGATDFLVWAHLDQGRLVRSIRYSVEQKRREKDLLQAKNQVMELAQHDFLTGLINRNFFLYYLSSALAQAIHYQGYLGMMMVDLGRFKEINKWLGPAGGDLLLKSVSERLLRITNKNDIVARIGGDEFAIILKNHNNINDSIRFAKSVLAKLSLPYTIENKTVIPHPSIGISYFPECGKTSDRLMNSATITMSHVKRMGRDHYELFTPLLEKQFDQQNQLINDLRDAEIHGELELYYQPQLDLIQEKLVGVESLLRWDHPLWGGVGPSQFVPIAEESDLIISLGKWVLHQACAQHKRWQQELGVPPVIAINVSFRQLNNKGFVSTLHQVLELTQVDPSCLEIELTESALMENPEVVIAQLTHLRSLGIRIAIDDFGTGYSSLSYLRKLPIDVIKIDQTFVANIGVEAQDEAIIRAVISISQSMGLTVIAEGVETKDQVDFLQHNGCHIIQGYYFSKPLPAAELTQLLKGPFGGGDHGKDYH